MSDAPKLVPTREQMLGKYSCLMCERWVACLPVWEGQLVECAAMPDPLEVVRSVRTVIGVNLTEGPGCSMTTDNSLSDEEKAARVGVMMPWLIAARLRGAE